MTCWKITLNASRRFFFLQSVSDNLSVTIRRNSSKSIAPDLFISTSFTISLTSPFFFLLLENYIIINLIYFKRFIYLLSVGLCPSVLSTTINSSTEILPSFFWKIKNIKIFNFFQNYFHTSIFVEKAKNFTKLYFFFVEIFYKNLQNNFNVNIYIPFICNSVRFNDSCFFIKKIF